MTRSHWGKLTLSLLVCALVMIVASVVIVDPFEVYHKATAFIPPIESGTLSFFYTTSKSGMPDYLCDDNLLSSVQYWFTSAHPQNTFPNVWRPRDNAIPLSAIRCTPMAM